MKSGTVTLPIDEYNELRDFKNRMENGECYTATYKGMFGHAVEYKFLKEPEAIKEVIRANHKLSDALQNMINDQATVAKRISEEIKGKSLWGLIRWWQENK